MLEKSWELFFKNAIWKKTEKNSTFRALAESQSWNWTKIQNQSQQSPLPHPIRKKALYTYITTIISIIEQIPESWFPSIQPFSKTFGLSRLDGHRWNRKSTPSHRGIRGMEKKHNFPFSQHPSCSFGWKIFQSWHNPTRQLSFQG